MNEMNTRDYRDYDNRYYDEAEHGYRSYRDYRNYRDSGNYRDDYREDYRTRDYDRRGGKINNRSYRNYRGDYYEELEMVVEDMREGYRTLEDISEMVTNPQEKNVIMKVAQAEKENYHHLKQIMDK